MSLSRHRFVKVEENNHLYNRLINSEEGASNPVSRESIKWANIHQSALLMTAIGDLIGIVRGVTLPFVSDSMGKLAKGMAFSAAACHLFRFVLSVTMRDSYAHHRVPGQRLVVAHCVFTVSAVLLISIETGTQLVSETNDVLDYAWTALFQNVYSPAVMLFFFKVVEEL